MRKVILCFAFAAMAVVFFGCAGLNSANNEVANSDVQLEIAMGEQMISAFQKEDLQLLQKNLPPEIQKSFGKKEFDAECKNVKSRWGKIVGARYLSRLEMEPLHQHVWAVRFYRLGNKGQRIYQEVMFAILAGKVDGKSKIFLFGFK